MNNVLLTGGAGFLGSHVAEELIKRGNLVTILDDFSGGFEENIPKNTITFRGSITDAKLVDTIFEKMKINYVFHLAAYAAEGLSHFIKHFNYDNNLIGSINLINASINHNVKCFVFTSSIAVYGSNPILPMTEDTIPDPEDSYGIAKLAVEQELKICKEMFGLDYIIFRPHNIYGERQNIGDKYRNVVGIFMNQILQNKPMTIFGDGTQTRAFSYVKDVAPIIAKSIDVPEAYNQVFNVGADTFYSVNDLAEEVSRAMSIESNIIHLPARNEVQSAYSSHEKVKKIFGERKQYRLEEGLSNMAQWVRQHGARSSKTFEGIEVIKNFPKAWLQ